MLTEPTDVDQYVLLEFVRKRYSGCSSSLIFEPLGEDSWCYSSGDLWISLRRDLRGHDPAAYQTATHLKEGGLEFVLAPKRSMEGKIVYKFGRYPLVVFPRVEAVQLTAPTIKELGLVRFYLKQLHEWEHIVDRVETFEMDFIGRLIHTLKGAETDSDRGPYWRAVWQGLEKSRTPIQRLINEAAVLREAFAHKKLSHVLTHGDLSAHNVLRAADRLIIADWGALMMAPAERDWFHFLRTLGPAGNDWPAKDDDILRFYAIRWTLSEIAEYAEHFSNAHEDSDDEAAMWQRLQGFLSAL